MRPLGASSSVVSHRAFQGLTRKHGGDCALFLCREGDKGKGRSCERSVRKAGSGRTARKLRLARGLETCQLQSTGAISHDLIGARSESFWKRGLGARHEESREISQI